jgi:hypothetical protein
LTILFINVVGCVFDRVADRINRIRDAVLEFAPSFLRFAFSVLYIAFGFKAPVAGRFADFIF